VEYHLEKAEKEFKCANELYGYWQWIGAWLAHSCGVRREARLKWGVPRIGMEVWVCVYPVLENKCRFVFVVHSDR
jgi:hypothetical protein